KFMEPFKDLAREGIYFPSFLFFDEDSALVQGEPKWKLDYYAYSRVRDQFEQARLYEARLVANSLHVTGNLIDTVPVSDNDLLSKLATGDLTYIGWLLTKSANQILGSNAIHDPAKIPSTTLLFLMLRQSLLQAYQEAA